VTTNSEARKRREEACAVTADDIINSYRDELIKARARIAELEARCHITTDAAGHLSCQTCRRSAEA
jgi:hypothetical protein